MVVWLASLDSTKSRSQGRCLPKSQSIQTPRIDELESAARKLSLEPETSKSSALPFRWWDKTGYVLVKLGSRRRPEVLKNLAAEISRARQAKS
jgi:signal recognition particle subunit SRP19